MLSESSLWEGITIDGASWVPAYYQLEEAIRSLLSGGALRPGMRLPPERELATQLGVSRMTVRGALQRLERDGLLDRRRGDGTYVAAKRIDAGLRFSSFTSELAGRVSENRTRVLDLSAVRPDATLRGILGVADEAEAAIRLQRVRYLDGVPTTLETAWLPADSCKQLLGLNLQDRSLYSILTEDFGLHPARATERLVATVLGDFEASHLDREAGSAALLVERTTYDRYGSVIEHVHTVMRADRVALTAEVEIEPEGGPDL